MYRILLKQCRFEAFLVCQALLCAVSGEASDIESDLGKNQGHCSVLRDQSASPHSLHWMNFRGEFLYWKPIEEGLRYSVSKTPSPIDLSPTIGKSRSKEQEFEYAQGLRIAATTTLGNDWGLEGIWTSLHHAFPRTSIADPNGHLFANLIVPTIGYVNQLATHASGKWKLGLDSFNLEFRRPIEFDRAIMFAPILGVHGFIISQNFNASYALAASDYNETTPYPQAAKTQVESWGVGPALGTEIRMMIRKWSLFLKGAFSLMAGRYSVSTNYPNIVDYAIGSNYFILESKQRLFAMGQIKTGVAKWWRVASNSSIELMLGWESQIWWNQQSSSWFSTLAMQSNSDLTFYGPFASLSFGF